jgi:alpha-1,3/alpha-1,6-mannosyltransferase
LGACLLQGIGLAIEALAEVLKQLPRSSARLVVAGGYDVRLVENVNHLEELRTLATTLGVAKHVKVVCWQ